MGCSISGAGFSFLDFLPGFGGTTTSGFSTPSPLDPLGAEGAGLGRALLLAARAGVGTGRAAANSSGVASNSVVGKTFDAHITYII